MKDSTSTRKHFACGSYQTEGFMINRSDECHLFAEIEYLTKERDTWKDAAKTLRESFVPNTVDHPAVAFYEAVVNEYGL